MPKRILIVDDEEDIVHLLKLRLKASGYEITSAKDVKSAVRHAKKVPPHLIIIDIKMPCGGGEFVFNELKSSPRTRDIPFLFISALHEREIEKRIYAIGGAHYMTKPFNSKDLLNKISALIGLENGNLQNPE